MTLQILINRELERAQITPYKLAKISGVKEAVIYKIIKGEREDIMLSTAKKLAAALQLDINKF
ncbi:MAG TPA: helix-turn-helix transcriptional regulator [Lactobacillaceae bacterium]|jgi:plasmid maintenance system antidote protein VapI